MTKPKHPKTITVTLTWREACWIRCIVLDAWSAHNARRDPKVHIPTYNEKWLNLGDSINNKIEKEGELANVIQWKVPKDTSLF